MGKVCRVKQRTNRPKKGRGFLRHRSVSVADVSDEIPSTTDTANEGVHVNESTDNVNIVNNESNLLVNSNESPCTSVNTLNSTNLSTVSTASSIKVQQFEAHTPNSKDKISGIVLSTQRFCRLLLKCCYARNVKNLVCRYVII